MVSDDTLVSDKHKRLGDLLRSEYGATGKEFGNLVSSVVEQLPLSAMLSLRRIAQIRNSIIKDRMEFPVSIEQGIYHRLDCTREDFLRLCDDVEFLLAKSENILYQKDNPLLHYIINVSTNGVIELSPDADGHHVRHNNTHSGNHEKWLLTPNIDKTISITSQISNLCLSLDQCDISNGTFVVLQQDNKEEHQKWYLSEHVDGSYKIQSKLSGLYLDLSGFGWSNHLRLVQWGWYGSPSQTWQLKIVVPMP